MTEAQRQVRGQQSHEFWRYAQRNMRKRLIAKYLTIDTTDGYFWHLRYKGYSLGCWTKHTTEKSHAIIDSICDCLFALEMHGDIKPKEANDGQSKTL